MSDKPRHPRELDGRFAIDNPDDKSPIREMVKVDGKLLMVTDNCTYRQSLPKTCLLT